MFCIWSIWFTLEKSFARMQLFKGCWILCRLSRGASTTSCTGRQEEPIQAVSPWLRLGQPRCRPFLPATSTVSQFFPSSDTNNLVLFSEESLMIKRLWPGGPDPTQQGSPCESFPGGNEGKYWGKGSGLPASLRTRVIYSTLTPRQMSTETKTDCKYPLLSHCE